MKIRRNDPCPCGSGIKYKKCCWLLQGLLQNIPMNEPYEHGKYLVGRPFISTEFKGQKVRAVGSTLALRPLNETFHEFLIDLYKETIGRQWGIEEQKKSIQQQHTLVRWVSELSAFVEKNKTDENKIKENLWSMLPSGNVMALISLAYDIYSVKHSAEIPKQLLKRLRDEQKFQGAKYELSIAGVFARSGYDIEWLPDNTATDKHGEFIAKHRVSGERVQVEAKSRHRSGTFHFAGTVKPPEELKADIRNLFTLALDKNNGLLPFVICIDLNLPMTPEKPPFAKEWFQEIKDTLSLQPKPTYENPDIFNALAITNFSWHYYKNDAAFVPGEFLLVVPLFTQKPFVDSNTTNLLYKAFQQYGGVPTDV